MYFAILNFVSTAWLQGNIFIFCLHFIDPCQMALNINFEDIILFFQAFNQL